MLWKIGSKKREQNQENSGFGKVRVGERGGAYIPSEEIADLPEIKRMQEMASAIVSRNLATTRKG